MKVFYVAILLLITTSISNSQWINQNPVPDGNELRSVFFIDDNNGWIAGSDGFITKTTNAGVEWVKQNSSTTAYLKSIFFINQSIGWVVGEGGLILKSTDSGESWLEQISGTLEVLDDVNFSNLNTGWIVGYNSTILSTTNGGCSWTKLSIPNIDRLVSVDFVNPFIGFAVGSAGIDGPPVFLKTTDGGLSWVDKSEYFLSSNQADYLLCVEFINENVGWVGSGMDQLIFKTTNGGDSWSTCDYTNLDQKTFGSFQLEPGGVRSIYFKDENIGFAVGGERTYHRKIYSTTDGGLTWYIKYDAQEEYDLISVYGTQAGLGWAVGSNGTIFITDNNGLSWCQQLSGGVLPSGEDNINSVYFIDDQIGWAAGERDNFIGGSGSTLIFKTTNGGKIWETKHYLYSSENSISCIYFKNNNIGWTNSFSNMLDYGLKTSDGGETWENCNLYFNSMIFIDENTGWIVGNNISKTTDGGETWLEKSSIGGTSIYFADEFNGWVAGDNGSILKSTDGGETWISKTSGTIENLMAVKFYDSSIGMCVGNEGTILSSADGGDNWVLKSSNTSENLSSIYFTDSSTVWFAGDNGTILQTTDLGINWVVYDHVTSNSLKSIFFVNENTGWIGGMDGTVFKYENQSAIPVELISFTAFTQNQQVTLKWIAVTELNNSGFQIERKANNSGWIKVGFVHGNGASIEPKSYNFIDENIFPGIYDYRIKQIDFDGSYNYYNLSETIEISIPEVFNLSQNYPNPFNPNTKIMYQLPVVSKVVIKIYNILGSEVVELLNEQKEPGVYEVEFNANTLSSGTYIYKISANNFIQTKKMLLIK